MKIAVITSANTGFFPSFYKNLSSAITIRGDKSYLLLPNSGINRNDKDAIIWGSRFNWFFHYHLYKLLGVQDVFSIFSTFSLIRKLNAIDPDILHLHVVNAWVINMPLFIRYINKHNLRVVWTMHDCRAFTGRCAYFDEVGCEKWKSSCGQCPEKKNYWPTRIDSSSFVWKLRRRYHSSIKNMIIVTPSLWLKGLAQSSFLGKYEIRCIYNGINLDKFSSPIRLGEDVLNEFENRKIILGIAAFWEDRKGLNSFLYIAPRMPKDWIIVLVGNMSPEQYSILPDNIKYWGATSDQNELIALYQRADVFVNPTLADNFPTTNIEALACGTPVVTFNTGGSGEAVDEHSGMKVEKGDNPGLLSAIEYVMRNKSSFSTDNCQKRAREFSLKQYDKYVDLYHKII